MTIQSMTIQSREFIAGAFVLSGVLGLFAIISVLGGFFQKTDTYHTHVSNVAGLKSGAAVIYEGYIIGSVSGITPKAQDNQMIFKIDLDVERGWQIPETSEAGIAALSLLSAMAIQITAGSGEALEPGDTIATSTKTGLVDALLSDDGTNTLSNISSLTANLAQELPAITRTLNDSAQHLNTIIASINPKTIDTIIGNTLTASQDVTTALDSINGQTLDALFLLLTETRTTINELNTIITASDDGIQGLIADARQTALNSKEFTYASADKVQAILARLDRAALNIEEMTATLKNNPAILITGTE